MAKFYLIELRPCELSSRSNIVPKPVSVGGEHRFSIDSYIGHLVQCRCRQYSAQR